MLARILSVLILLAAGAGARAEEAADARKAKAYLKEVKRHLLESFIDRERMKDEKLVAAAVRAMAAAMDHKDFDPLDRDARAGVKEALKEVASVDEAISAAEEKAPGIDLVRLADHAAEAMVKQTGDPFSRILTEKDMQSLLKMLQGRGREESAGLALQLESGKATVAYVQYGYPAFEEGIEIGDEIVEVRGRSASALRPDELPDLLRLPAGGTLELKVRRYGREYPFVLRGLKAAVKDVRHEYLGQGVGYLRLSMFDMGLVRDVRTALREMSAQGMKGVILDLRHNPGGALPAATGVADFFLAQDLLITRTVSHYKPSIGGLRLPGLALDGDLKTKTPSDYEQMPMVCLVNGASASASELLAGALKDHKRAVLVGSRTFGKGVGQTPIILSSMFMQRYLYLTVLRYTTPNGHDVDHKGVEPDVSSPEPVPTAAQFEAVRRLRESGDLEKYLDARWGPALRRLAEGDAFETSRWPGFDEFHRSLRLPFSADEVREELRRAARRRSAGEGKVWTCDLETDRVLQRGLVELLDKLEK
jgi:C-terminal peptidase prc